MALQALELNEEKSSLDSLRLKVSAIGGVHNKAILKFTHFPQGLVQGSLVELTGDAKLEWIVQFLKENINLKVFWIEEKFTLLPTAIEQRGVSLERFVFVESPEDIYKPLRQALKSKVFNCVITPRFTTEDRTLKALQLLAEEAEACVFLLAKQHVSSWPLSVQLTINKDKENFDVKILKHKQMGII
jgi:hypothetical protein